MRSEKGEQYEILFSPFSNKIPNLNSQKIGKKQLEPTVT